MADPEQQRGFDPKQWPGELSTGSKQNGNDAEQWVRDHYDLDPQDSDFCPESAHDAVDPRTNTPIEVKSCQIRYNGDGSRGRFQIWDYAHQDLLANDGGYIFIVHEPHTEGFHVYLHRPLSAEAVDELIGNWHPINHSLRPPDAVRTEVCQSAVFTNIQIERIEPHSGSGEPDGSDPDTDTGEAPQVERMEETLQSIRDIEAQHDDEMAPEGAVIQRAVEATGSDPETIQHHIEVLKKRGEIYCPREGHFRVT
jgi:hypothetical protein